MALTGPCITPSSDPSQHLSDRLENQLEHARQPNYIGNRFFREAEQLLLAELSHPSLTTLQALLVLTVAACSEGRDAQGWSYVESAVRVAEQMDLLRYNTAHTSPTTRGPGGVSTAAANMERSRAITTWGLFTLTRQDDQDKAVSQSRLTVLQQHGIWTSQAAQAPSAAQHGHTESTRARRRGR